MIESVSTLSVQGNTLRQASQLASSYVASQSVSSTVNFTGSRIRVDNILDMAILEFRSTDTGDVIRQYPTEFQIRAFERAAQADSRQQSAPVANEQTTEATTTVNTSASTSASIDLPAPPPVQISTSDTASAAPSAPVATSAPVTTAAPTTTQSVVA